MRRSNGLSRLILLPTNEIASRTLPRMYYVNFFVDCKVFAQRANDIKYSLQQLRHTNFIFLYGFTWEIRD